MGDLLDNIKSLSNKQLIIYLGCAVGAVMLALILVLTACQPSTPAPDESSDDPGITEEVIPNEEEEEPEAEPAVEVKAQVKNIEEAFNQNSDVVGWLYIPGLDINEPILQKAGNNKYPYNTKDWLGNSIGDFTNYPASCYYTHYNNKFGKSGDLSQNTVIFGHSSRGYRNPTPYVGDEPTDGKFSQLFNFKDDEFAKMTPYIYFSTADEDMVFEVFSVSYTDDGTWYIQQKDTTPATMKSQIDQMRGQSLYDYKVDVKPTDKILTLSTCTAAKGPMSADWTYRFVICAKLIDKKDATKTEADFVINEDIVYPAGFTFHNYDEARGKHEMEPLPNPIQTGNYKKNYLPLYEEKLAAIAEGKTLLDEEPAPEA